MEPFESPCGAKEPGLAALVDQARKNQTPAMTLEEVQRVGALDPVAYEIDIDIEDGQPLTYSLDKKEDGTRIVKIVEGLKVRDIPTHSQHTRTCTDITYRLVTTISHNSLVFETPTAIGR